MSDYVYQSHLTVKLRGKTHLSVDAHAWRALCGVEDTEGWHVNAAPRQVCAECKRIASEEVQP